MNKKIKIKFTIKYIKVLNEDLDLNPLKMKFNDTEYKLNLDFVRDGETREGEQEFTVFINAKDLSQITFNINTNGNFDKNYVASTYNLIKLIFKTMTEYLHDDINILLQLVYSYDLIIPKLQKSFRIRC